MSFDEIRFDMSRAGLYELETLLLKAQLGDELQNFRNVVQNLLERVPAAAPEADWLEI